MTKADLMALLSAKPDDTNIVLFYQGKEMEFCLNTTDSDADNFRIRLVAERPRGQ